MKSECLAILYLQKAPDARTMCSSYFSKTKYFLDIVKRNKKAHSHDLKPRFEDFRQMIISIYIGTDQRRYRSVCLTGAVFSVFMGGTGLPDAKDSDAVHTTWVAAIQAACRHVPGPVPSRGRIYQIQRMTESVARKMPASATRRTE